MNRSILALCLWLIIALAILIAVAGTEVVWDALEEIL